MFPRSRPRTWSGCAAKSKLTKRNVLCLAAVLSASTVPGTSIAEFMARRPAPQVLNHTKPSRAHPLHLQRNLLSTSPSSALAPETYATAPATGVVAALKSKRILTSRVNHLPLRSAQGYRSMSADITSSHILWSTNTSDWRRKRFLEMYFVRFVQCPSAVKRRRRKSKTSL